MGMGCGLMTTGGEGREADRPGKSDVDNPWDWGDNRDNPRFEG